MWIMDIRTRILTAAERLFDTNGFVATGMDRLTQASDVSSRTLYKHFGSKTGLMTAVLGTRDTRFMRRLDVPNVVALFDAIEDWMRVEGARGCLFLRTAGETGAGNDGINAAIHAHKEALHRRIGEIVAAEIGRPDEDLTEQILVLLEGATAAAVYRGPEIVAAARKSAETLIRNARSLA